MITGFWDKVAFKAPGEGGSSVSAPGTSVSSRQQGGPVSSGQQGGSTVSGQMGGFGCNGPQQQMA